jgi:signal transduction histidine kinase/HAMP domain-containing protein
LKARTGYLDRINLLTRLLLIVSVALVPALLFQVYSEIEASRIRRELVAGEALRLVQLVTAEQQRIVEGAQEVLTTIASARSVRDFDPDRCHQHMVNLRQQLPRYLRAAVADINGRVLCASGIIEPGVNVSDRSYFRLARSTGGFVIGEYAVGRVSREPSIHMALPFRNMDGIVAGVVYVGLGLDWLAEQLVLLPLPPGSAVSIADRNGIVLARHPDGARYVGQPLSSGGLAALQGNETAVAEMTGIDGVGRLTGLASLGIPPGGLRIAVALDPRTLFDAVLQPSRTGLILIVAGFALALAITALLGGRTIRRPVAALLQITHLWQSGDLTARTGLQKDGSEFGRLAAAFDAMAEAQEARDHALRMALESTTDCVIVLDRSWRFTFVNKRAAAKIAHGRDLIGLTIWDGFPWLENCAVSDGLRVAMQSGDPLHQAGYFAPADLHFDAHAYPSNDGLTVFFQDVTEKRRNEAALARSGDQLAAARARAAHAERLGALGQLAGGIAHDFNNLLQVVNGVATLIRRRPDDRDNVARLAQVALDATERGAAITHRLLAFGRRGDLHAERLDMAVLLEGIREICVHTLGGGIDLRIALQDGLPAAFADRAQLETVVVNLAINARDAMPQGGRLTISAATESVSPADPVHPAGLAPGRYVRLAVADTGTGMDADTLARAEEPFFTTKQGGLGTGLGLPMAAGFAEQSRGGLRIESSPGDGTTVTLWVPAHDPGRTGAER